MTIEEKREALFEFCEHHCSCDGCVLDNGDAGCYFNELSYEQVNDAFAKAFPEENDVVNHPAHYCRPGAMECIDEMILIFGKESVAAFCLCNAWKYRARAMNKNGEEDMAKSDWYLRKYAELKEMIKCGC